MDRQHISIKPAKIIAVNDDGTYQVLPLTGRSCGTPIDGVRPVIETTLSPGDKVILFWERPGEQPRILVSGGSGGTCFSSTQAWGILYG